MSANFGVLVGLTMTWFSEEMLISNICIRGFMCSAIKKSWKVSNKYFIGQKVRTLVEVHYHVGGISLKHFIIYMWFCEYTEWTVNFGVTQFCAFVGFEDAKITKLWVNNHKHYWFEIPVLLLDGFDWIKIIRIGCRLSSAIRKNLNQ